MKLLLILQIWGMFSSAWALNSDGSGPADIRNSAVALYVFNDANFNPTTKTYKDLAPNPLDLQIVRTNGLYYLRGDNLELTEGNLLRSVSSADKITNACSASNELTLEMWIDSRTPADKLVNHEDDKLGPTEFKQSLRIISLGDTYFKEYHNFGFFQAYNMGDAYKAATRTTGNSNTSLSGDLVQPLVTENDSLLLQTKQHVVYVKSKGGTAKLFVSDENGNDSLVTTAVRGFGGDQTNWHKSGKAVSYDTPDDNSGVLARNLDIRLAIGNDASADNDFSKPTQGGEGPQKHSRNWPWMGHLYMVAIYCRALTDYEVLGDKAPHLNVPKVFPINLNQRITPSMTRAQAIYTRITSVKTPMDNPIIADMAARIDGNDEFGAAGLATTEANFFNLTVRDMAARMSTRDEVIATPLNDFVATVVGAVRDGLDVRTLLTGNYIYAADPQKAAVPSHLIRDQLTSNKHYESLTAGGFDLVNVLKAYPGQKLYNGSTAVDNPDPAGLLTSRSFMSAHAIAGTNRRMVEFTFREFLCTPIDKWADANGSDSFVGRDVDRFPSGSHTKFTTTCRACHSRMDPLRGAFAYFTFSNSFIKHSFVADRLPTPINNENMVNGVSVGLRPGDPALTQLSDLGSVAYVVEKMNHNDDVFPGGRVIIDNSFQNSATEPWGQNYFGWRGPTKGNGVNGLGAMVANSQQFSRCLAKRVFASVCKREALDFDDALIQQSANEFESNGYKLDYLFKRIVITPNCIGEAK